MADRWCFCVINRHDTGAEYYSPELCWMTYQSQLVEKLYHYEFSKDEKNSLNMQIQRFVKLLLQDGWEPYANSDRHICLRKKVDS